MSKSSLRRTSSSASSLRRSILASNRSERADFERRQTWQTDDSLSASHGSRLDDDDLAATLCCAQPAASSDVFLAPPAIAIPGVRADRAWQPHPLRQVAPVRRTKSEQTNLNNLTMRENRKARSKSAQDAPKRVANVKIVLREHADDAIASDSEDDDDECNTALSLRISAQRNRLDYATRRVLTDEKNAAIMHRVQQVATPPELYSPISTPVPDASDITADLIQVCQKLERVYADNAIASDSESDDDYTCKGDPKMTAALQQAAIHGVHNAVATQIDAAAYMGVELQKRAMSDAGLTSRVTDPSHSVKLSPHRRNVSAGNLTVRLIPPQSTKGAEVYEHDGKTPIEVATFDKGAVLAMRSLRPSKTRPKPTKGVLKKTGSPPSTGVSTAECSPSKTVQTRISHGNDVDGLLKPMPPPKLIFKQPAQSTASENGADNAAL